MVRYTCLYALLLLTGCVSTTSFYDSTGNKVAKIEQRGSSGSAAYETEGYKMSVDYRKDSFYHRNILPLFRGVQDKVNVTAE